MNIHIEREPGMVPLLITARFAEPVVYYGDLLHADAFLDAGHYYSLPPEERGAMPSVQGPDVLDMPLPVARWYVPVEDESLSGKRLLHLKRSTITSYDWLHLNDKPCIWGWCASAELLPWETQGTTNMAKRPPLAQAVRWTRDGSLNISSGHLKAYQLVLGHVQARLQSWCVLGHEDRVRALLEHVHAVGKKRNTGHGTVLSWSVERADTDHSVHRDGVATRRMPKESGLQGQDGAGALRAPYYHRSRAYPHTVEPAVQVSVGMEVEVHAAT